MSPTEVLLVEDNPGDIRLVEEAFSETDAEATLQVATDGVEAIEMLSRRRDAGADSLPDLVLLDLNLPRMDGFEVLDGVNDDLALSCLLVLVLTSSDDRDDVAECYDRAANAYLTKPTAPDEFIALVQAIVAFWVKCARLPPASA